MRSSSHTKSFSLVHRMRPSFLRRMCVSHCRKHGLELASWIRPCSLTIIVQIDSFLDLLFGADFEETKAGFVFRGATEKWIRSDRRQPRVSWFTQEVSVFPKLGGGKPVKITHDLLTGC